MNDKLRKLYARGSNEQVFVLVGGKTFLAKIESVNTDTMALIDENGNRAYIRLDAINGVYGLEFAGAPRQ